MPYAYEPQLLHPACALDVDTVAFTAAFSECSDRMPDWAALNALVTTRNAAIDQRRSAQWLSYSIPDMPGLRSISEPIHAFEDDRHWVSPARDAQGRPRVRVLCAGSAFSREHTSSERIDALTHVRSWASPKREYVFEQREGARALECDDDPAQPIVATLYAPIATSDSLIEGEEHLQLWRALRFGVSMLWLIGADSGRTRDEHTLRFRELLVSNGLDGDRCPVLYAPEITEAALDHLVLALDEHVDGSELRVREAPLRAIARTVRDDVCAQSNERAEPRAWSFRLDKLSATKDTVIDGLLSEAAIAAIDRGDLDLASEIFQSGSVFDERVYQRWIARIFERSAFRHRRFLDAIKQYARTRPSVVPELWFAALRACNDIDTYRHIVINAAFAAKREHIAAFEAFASSEQRSEFAEIARYACDSLPTRAASDAPAR